MSFVVLISLLALTAFAVQRLGAGYFWLGIYGLALSGVTHWVYALDKPRSEAGAWRVPEARMHLLELLGGWPGALLAQRRLRHKCSKPGYQVIFGAIILAYQFAACDSFQNWKCTRAAVNCLEQTSHQR